MFTLTRDEGERRWKNIRKAMEKRGLECLIVWGSQASFRNMGANLKYLSNATTEGYLVFPAEDGPTLFNFEGARDPIYWVADVRSGFPKYSQAISERLKETFL